MSKKAVFCIAASVFQAVCIVDRLKDGGFLSANTSLLFIDKTKSLDVENCQIPSKAADDITDGAVSSAMLSGAVNWLPGVGSFIFPGIGLVIAAGPIWPTLGSERGSLSSALNVMGIPEYETGRYEAALKQGRILISIHVKGAGEARDAEQIFTEEGATEIASSSEVFAPKRELSTSAIAPSPYAQPSGNRFVPAPANQYHELPTQRM